MVFFFLRIVNLNLTFTITVTLNVSNVGNCCARVGSGVQTDTTLPAMLVPAAHLGKEMNPKT